MVCSAFEVATKACGIHVSVPAVVREDRDQEVGHVTWLLWMLLIHSVGLGIFLWSLDPNSNSKLCCVLLRACG